MKPILEIQQVSKTFRLLHEQQSYLNLRDSIAGLFKPSKTERELFHALRDVSFNVMPGDTLGIIGKNGAGKSTLLKVLSKITPPSTGKITVRGRIASLLEVGTGFHGELSGRENIFFNGSILGMKREEIKKHFDAIVDFSGTEKFLDTPLKHYSSGMQLRLAFAVAAFLEPEILIIDEVLAVGDAEFQNRCLGKMEEVSKSGRTILFVSHNLKAVQTLCKRAILLERGQVKMDTEQVSEAIRVYLSSGSSESGQTWIATDNSYNDPNFSPKSLSIVDANGDRVEQALQNREHYFVRIEGEIREASSALTLGYAIYSEDGLLLYSSCQTDCATGQVETYSPGTYIFTSPLPQSILNEGDYRIELIASLHYIRWICEPGKDVPTINISINDLPTESPFWMTRRPGILAPALPWNVQPVSQV
jgi:lipopolysaccharide transport system ATP-binding protein